MTPELTLFIITDEDHFLQRCPVIEHDRNVVSNVNLASFINNDRFDGDVACEGSDIRVRQHPQGTEHHAGSG